MKTVYIFLFAAFGTCAYAQTADKQNNEVQEIPKETRDAFEKMRQDSQNQKILKTDPTKLASEQELPEAMKAKAKPETPAKKQSTGKLLPNTATLEEILAAMPNRQDSKNTKSVVNNSPKVQGLPNTATLEEIKKTIPRN